jgi:DNA polymerase III epsilon subunit family exonuclease
MDVAVHSGSLNESTFEPPTPSPSQREAIEAGSGPILVLAGPGAGKTFCLAERIRFLIEHKGVDPSRICAFTFTNKAAGEIASRLARHLGERASRVKGGTIHAFCAELLREFGTHVGLKAGFGIADEDYQRAALRRIGSPSKWAGNLLVRFSANRFRDEPLHPKDVEWLEKYERFLVKRNMVDYDTLVMLAADLMSLPDVADVVRSRWDYVLVDEFQDLNRKQYAVIHELARTHRNIFVVGDDEQSIYSWAGADPKVFTEFANDFGVTRPVYLQENRRCPRHVFAFARQLMQVNPSLFTSRLHATPDKESPFPVGVLTFENETDEMAWVVDDIRRDREAYGLEWGEIALLYRTNRIGDQAESTFLNAGIPVKLARGRALSEDPVVAYVIAALRVIANPGDLIHKENFLGTVLPRTLIDSARASAEENQERVVDRLDKMGRILPSEDADGRKIRRGFSALRNLAALGSRYTAISPLVAELLSQRVGEYRTILDELYHELSDPAGHPDVVALAGRLRAAIDGRRPVRIGRLGGMEIAMKGVLLGLGVVSVELGGPLPAPGTFVITGDETPGLGAMLGLFKAAQLISSAGFTNAFRDFTAVDIETTGRDASTVEIVDIAAVRVRQSAIVDEFQTLVKPRIPIEAGAMATHGITDVDVANAPSFEALWPAFREFCGRDVLVAHNGNQFDFPVIRRMAKELHLDGAKELTTYDTLPLARELRTGSAKLGDLARSFGIDTGQAHRALDDTRALARVFLALSEAKIARARTTALASSLDLLGVGLALSNEKLLGEEGLTLRRMTWMYALGRYTECLEFYRTEREKGDDHSIPTVDELVEALGGEERMLQLRTDKVAEQRYPQAMARMRSLLDHSGTGSLSEQIGVFLEKAALSSRPDGAEPARARVNLLTLHSTKGLEFSRVYVLGVEDSQLIGGTQARPTSREEVEEARRLLYVGMTRTMERLVLTRVVRREGEPTGGHQFLDEMGLVPRSPG